jgi:hypothetical protein
MSDGAPNACGGGDDISGGSGGRNLPAQQASGLSALKAALQDVSKEPGATVRG